MNKEKWKFLGFLLLMGILVGLILGSVTGGEYMLQRNRKKYDKERTEALYGAWCKETGNKHNLTIQEFKHSKTSTSGWGYRYVIEEPTNE